MTRPVLLLALLACACRTLPTAERCLTLAPGGYLTGEVGALGEPEVFDAEDYVYDAALTADGRALAFSRLGEKSFFLSLWSLGPPPARAADVAVNGYEFDVEALAWAPDGQWVAAVSRDGALRLFDAHGAPVAAWLSDEKLTAVAAHPSGHTLAFGSEHGLVTLLAVDEAGLHFLHEQRLHGDEVRALAFAPDGRLFSASWDKTVRVSQVTPKRVRPSGARVLFERKGGQTLASSAFTSPTSPASRSLMRLKSPWSGANSPVPTVWTAAMPRSRLTATLVTSPGSGNCARSTGWVGLLTSIIAKPPLPAATKAS